MILVSESSANQSSSYGVPPLKTPYEIPSKFALMEYVLECASDVGFCMKPPKTIGVSQKKDTFLLVHACAFCGVCMVFA